jgi:hypothetical protein
LRLVYIYNGMVEEPGVPEHQSTIGLRIGEMPIVAGVWCRGLGVRVASTVPFRSTLLCSDECYGRVPGLAGLLEIKDAILR